MFGEVALDIDMHKFDHIFDERKKKVKVKLDTDLSAEDLKAIIADYQKLVKKETGKPFPQDAREQLAMSRDAVFRSWWGKNAVTYRRMEKIPDEIGTAANVQAMVFGNLGETSGTGVGFTRNPATGEQGLLGRVPAERAGRRRSRRHSHAACPSRIWKRSCPTLTASFATSPRSLEKHYRDMQDFEFTIENGKLFMLQTRNGKRTGAAALRVAVEMVKEGLIDKREAVLRVAPPQLDQLLHPLFDQASLKTLTKIANGIDASPGAAVGRAVFTPTKPSKALQEGPGDPDPQGNHAGRHSRHGSSGRRPHCGGRQVEPRGRGRARHGSALRGRRGRAAYRRAQETVHGEGRRPRTSSSKKATGFRSTEPRPTFISARPRPKSPIPSRRCSSSS